MHQAIQTMTNENRQDNPDSFLMPERAVTPDKNEFKLQNTAKSYQNRK